MWGLSNGPWPFLELYFRSNFRLILFPSSIDVYIGLILLCKLRSVIWLVLFILIVRWLITVDNSLISVCKMREVHKKHLTLTAHWWLNTSHFKILVEKIDPFSISVETRERAVYIEKVVSSSSHLTEISGASFQCVVPFHNHNRCILFKRIGTSLWDWH